MPIGPFGPGGWFWDPAISGGLAPVPKPRTVPTMLWVNDTPLERLGFTLQRPSAWLHGASRVLPETERTPDFTGGLYAAQRTAPALDITLEGVLLDVPLEQQQAALARITDWFSGELELRWPHAPGTVMYGVAGPLLADPLVEDQAFVQPDRTALRLSLTIRCADTARYEREPYVLRLSTTPTPIVMGGLPVGGVMTLDGPLSGAVDIEILTVGGVRVGLLALRDAPGLPVLLEEGDTLRIHRDAPHALIKRTAGGDATNVFAWRSLSLSFGGWHASPLHGDAGTGNSLMVRLSTGSGWWEYAIAHAH